MKCSFHFPLPGSLSFEDDYWAQEPVRPQEAPRLPPFRRPALLSCSSASLGLLKSLSPPTRHCCKGLCLAWDIRLYFLRTAKKRSVFPSFQRVPPTFIFADRNQTWCSLSGFTISWLLENIVFKPSLGNGRLAIKNDTRLLYFELLVLNHAGLGCGSMAEHLPTESKALSSIPSTIKPVIHCGKPDLIWQYREQPRTQGLTHVRQVFYH